MDYVAHLHGEHLDWLRGAGVAAARLRAGPVGGHDRRARVDAAVRARCSARRASVTSSTSGATTSRTTGRHGGARSRIICRDLSEHRRLIGLLLGTEEDWPAAFEALVGRLGPVDGTTLRTERIFNEPFDLRYRPRYALVIDRLAWWYDLPRAWLKKIALMDDVYLLNNPFTFQAMEKHSAYCALMRLGIRVPETWLIPHKVPPVEPALPADGRAVQRAVRPRGDRRADRLPAVHEAVRRRPVDRRLARRLARGAARALRRLGRADDAPADRARGVRRVRALALDRRRDDVDVVRPEQADVRPLPGAARLPHAGARRRDRDRSRASSTRSSAGSSTRARRSSRTASPTRSTTRTRRRTSR